MNTISDSLDNVPVACPKCGRVSDSIKCYSLPNFIIFLGFYAAYSSKKEICCPHCMRKQIFIKYFTYNIVIGNCMWLIMGFPAGILKLCSSYTKGHSDTVKKILAESISESSKQSNIEPMRYNQYGNPIYNQKYDINI